MSEFVSTRVYTLADVQRVERAAYERGYAEGVRDAGSGRLRPGSPAEAGGRLSEDWIATGTPGPSRGPEGGWQGNG